MLGPWLTGLKLAAAATNALMAPSSQSQADRDQSIRKTTIQGGHEEPAHQEIEAEGQITRQGYRVEGREGEMLTTDVVADLEGWR